MSKKIALFTFNEDPFYFVHAFLNALDMKAKGYDVKLIIEGSATKLVSQLTDPKNQFAELYQNVKKAGLIDCVCKACATMTGSLKSAEEQELLICSEMSGHPSIERYMEAGYEIMTF